jgi:ABC-2 type transport system ATP-binding protein
MAVKSLNIALKPGEVLGLLVIFNKIISFKGPNGAGKTSLISMITGLYKPEYGNTWVAGNSIKDEYKKKLLIFLV